MGFDSYRGRPRFDRARGPDRDRYDAPAARDYRDYGARDPGADRDRGYGRAPHGYDYDDRNFLDRAGDEVRSWFGDEEAERRRRLDDRYGERDEHRHGYDRPDGGYGRDRYAARDGAAWGAGDAWGLGAGWGAGDGRGGARRHEEEARHDQGYRSWRDRQMSDFDRDYDEYRREHQSRFDREFRSWRENRQTQRTSLERVTEHQEVVGSDGQHIGTVDKVRGDRIILTKTDRDAGGHHHSIPSSWLTEVTDKVTISKTADQAKQHWRDEERDAGGDWNKGTGMLGRSFSGTY